MSRHRHLVSTKEEIKMSEIKYEEPCQYDGQACLWVGEEFYDANGEVECFDLYCDKCFRYRDWSKEELPTI
jgi:hypothetical protein